MAILGLIKVCPNPNCDAVYHNVPKKETHCKNCNGNIMIVNEDTYWKKFATNYFQYEFETEEYFRPVKKMN